MRRGLWNGRRTGALQRLWADGATAGAIAKKLGLSRSAVLGKIFRLRLDAGAAGQGPAAKAKTRAKEPGIRAAHTVAPSAPVRRRRAGASVQMKPPEVPARLGRKSILELTKNCCRWPYGELGKGNYLFCGAPGADLDEGIPYCARHMRRAYIVAPAPASRAAKAKSSYFKSSSFRPRRFVLQSVEEGQ